MQRHWKKPGSLFSSPSAPLRVRPRGRGGFFAGIGRMIRRLCLFLGAMVLVSMTVSCAAGIVVGSYNAPLPEKMILTLRLNDGLSEYSPEDDFFREFASATDMRLSIQEIVDALDRARNDDRVRGIAVMIEGGSFDIAHTQELRAAIKRFRAAGKPAWAYSPSYAEAGAGGMGSYYLAAAFDEIWVQPVGMVALAGFDAQSPFVLDALKKIGVNPQFYQRKEYKSVMENMTRSSMSPENREMISSLLSSITGQIMTDIRADRRLGVDAMSAILNKGVLTDSESLSAGLVTRVDYPDILVAVLKQKLAAGGDEKLIKTISLSRYNNHHTDKAVPPNAPVVGIVYAQGSIVADSSSGGMGGSVAGADRIASAILRSVRDRDVKAIILRIDSPGGSPTASETIRRAVAHAVEKNIPVIVSMGPMAGSGGYWIATDATRIFAMPATLTGSIGVASGKMELSGLMEKIGVNWDGVKIGENADLWSFTKPFTPGGDERMNVMMDSMYSAFIQRVSAGRKMPAAAVEKIAKGRVWTGAQALDIGLVDELGGLDSAMDYTAKVIGVPDRTALSVEHLPRPKSPIDRILRLMKMEVLMGHAGSALMKSVEQAAAPKIMVYDPVLNTGF